MKPGYLFFVFVLTAAVFAQTGQQTVDRSTSAGASQGDAQNLQIGPGDLLDINVYDVPELILKMRVDDNGNVALPLVGTEHWAGLTPLQAQDLLKKKLVEGGFVKTPEATILVDEYATQGISVGGEVNQPGIYPLLGPHRLNDAISAAGGLTPRAGHTVTIEHRDDPENPMVLELPNSRNLSSANIFLRPGDSVVVAKAGVVYVVGDVVHPGAFLMENNTRLTILQAIAMSQGPTKTALLTQARIVRKTPQGVQEVPVALDKIMKGRMPDRLLEADDIVFLPSSKLKDAGAVTVHAAIAAAASIAAYTVH